MYENIFFYHIEDKEARKCNIKIDSCLLEEKKEEMIDL